ncbi:hypothetical protein [Larkinella sp. C7]|uniref:hypothetical protein n=1 Tax=Larkinella sp. C7 TaxID=2576607 RepID=UPI0014870E50|nr:hypothetical protein [Larkinella sp. C7]
MLQGIIKKTRAEIELIKRHLRENEGKLTEEETNQLLDRLGQRIALLSQLEDG